MQLQVTWAAESETYTAKVAGFSNHQAMYPFKIVYDEFGDESWGAFSRDKFTTVDGCHAFEFVGQAPSPVASLQGSPGQPSGSSPQPAPDAAAPSQTVEGYQGHPSASAKAVDCAASPEIPAKSPQGPRPGSSGPQAARAATDAPKKRKRDEEGDEPGSASGSQERPEVPAGSLKDLLGAWPACTSTSNSAQHVSCSAWGIQMYSSVSGGAGWQPQRPTRKVVNACRGPVLLSAAKQCLSDSQDMRLAA